MTESDLHASRVDTPAGVGPGTPAPDDVAPGTGPVNPSLDDTIFRTTQRIPRIVDDAAPAPVPAQIESMEPSSAEKADPRPRGLIPVLLIAVASLAALIAWPLLTTTPAGQRPALTTPTASASQTRTPPASPEAVTSPASVAAEPAPAPPKVLPTAQPVQTVTVTAVATSAPAVTASATPSRSATPSGKPSAGPSLSPTAIPRSGWTFSLAGVGPITLGMPRDAAVAAGYLSPGTDPLTDATSPALGEGLQLSVLDGRVAVITVTDRLIRSASGVGVGTPLTALSATYGASLQTLPALDTLGRPVTVLGVQDAVSYVAFAASDGAVSAVVVGLRDAGRPVVPGARSPGASLRAPSSAVPDL